MPARKKRLHDFVKDKTFLARRHAPLLLSNPLIWDDELRELQERYQQQDDTYARRKVALRFEKLVRETEEEQHSRRFCEILEEIAARHPGRPRKTLPQLIESGGFHPDRHKQLLAGEILPAECPYEDPWAQHLWQILRKLQIAYQQDDPSVAYSAETIRFMITRDFKDNVTELRRHNAKPA
jgi:hypothetical protein